MAGMRVRPPHRELSKENKMIPIFRGYVEKGRLQLEHRDKLDEYIPTLEGKRVEMTIKAESESRSVQQNRYYWGVIVKMLSDYTGHDQGEMHEILKYKFNPINIEIDGKEITVGGTTRDLTTTQFKDYNDRIKMWAITALNVTIPNVGEVDYEQV
jgi:hypothetical protein